MADDSISSSTQAGGGQSVTEELNPEIGLLGALAIGVGTMIAAGIFVLSGLAVEKVGAVAILSFLIAAIVAAFTAAAYAEFSSIYQESGGGYMYTANTFDNNLTYIMGWTMILGYPASAAFYLAAFSDWFYRFIYPALSIPEAIPFWVPGIVILSLLVLVNMRGTEESNQFQIIVTGLKVALLLLFLYGGLQALDPAVIQQSVTENISEFANIGLTSALVFITFFGFSAIATNAEEIKDPGDTIPKAIYLSMGIVTVIYTLVVLVIVIAVNSDAFVQFLAANVDLGGVDAAEYIATHGEVSMGYAARFFLGLPYNAGFYVIIVGALFSMLSAANATIMAGSRVKLAMSRRNHLPRSLEAIHPNWGTPYKTVLMTGGLIFLYIFVFAVLFGETGGSRPLFGIHLGIEGLAQFANFLLITGLTVVNVALVVNRRKYPDINRGFRVPLVPIIPAIAVLANLVLIGTIVTDTVGQYAVALGVLAEVIGVGIWFAWKSRTPSVEQLEEETPTAVAEYTAPGNGYQIVVPIANPRNAPQLMRTATTLANENDGEVLVMSAVTVPNQTPLSRGRERTGEKRAVLDQAMDIAEEEGVPVSGTIRIGHHAADAIINTVAQHGSDAVLVGWGGDRSSDSDVVLGSVVDRVVAEADCDVFVERIGIEADGDLDSILLPTAGGPHAELAAETAAALARGTGATVTSAYVIDPDASDAEYERARSLLASATEAFETGGAFETTLLEGEDVVATLVEASADHDLTIIGATREGAFQRFLFGTIPETVAMRASNTVIMAKRNLDVRSRLQQSIDILRERLTGQSNTMEQGGEE
ncbi:MULTISPECIES: amino acid permease [Halobacteriales]|uniref:Amino acid permease n=3 Tax=Halobacteriales TaxID=2235 RepID=A0A8U0I354_9EURY|nr:MULTISPECIES: amino acid permease [Halobacteriales]UPV77064.1 amino acid permease [Halorussus limi]USZ78444.1 amino acid permease [Halorussus vallis]